MNRLPMQGIWAAAALAVSCAAVPPPVTNLPDSPVSPSGEEAPWNPQFRYLETKVETETPGPVGSDAMEHDHESMQQDPAGTGDDRDAMDHDNAISSDAGAALTELSYACPMHSEVRGEGPGTCPICGLALEPQPSPAIEGDG